MRHILHYYACNSKTLQTLLRGVGGTFAYKNEATGVVSYKDRYVIVDDFITGDGIHEVYAGFKGELSFNDYDSAALATAVYPGQGSFLGLQYVTHKACGEAGEFAENVGKAMRDDGIVIDSHEHHDGSVSIVLGTLKPERQALLIGELGDELWYWFAKCRELGVEPADVARANIEKLSRRAREGKIHGSGSER